MPFPAKCHQLLGNVCVALTLNLSDDGPDSTCSPAVEFRQRTDFPSASKCLSVIKIQENYIVLARNETVNACCMKDLSWCLRAAESNSLIVTTRQTCRAFVKGRHLSIRRVDSSQKCSYGPFYCKCDRQTGGFTWEYLGGGQPASQNSTLLLPAAQLFIWLHCCCMVSHADNSVRFLYLPSKSRNLLLNHPSVEYNVGVLCKFF